MPEIKITVKTNGPLRVEGDGIALLDVDGKPFGLAGRTGISLCRCGSVEAGNARLFPGIGSPCSPSQPSPRRQRA